MTNKSARLLFESKREYGEFIEEMKMWRVPVSPHYPHGLSYRLWFGRPGETLVLYDVHHGKPYHIHRESRVFDYEFRDVRTLISDFRKDTAPYRGIPRQ